MKSKLIPKSSTASSQLDVISKYKEEIKLYKIIKGSKRVQEARDMMNLSSGEYIVQFNMYVSNDWDDTKILNASGQVEIKKLLHYSKSDSEYYDEVVSKFVEVEIVDYFELKLPLEFVMNAIFKKLFVPQSFLYFSRMDKKTGFYEIKIQFLETLNPSNKKLLKEKIAQSMYLVEEFHRTKNTQGLNTGLPSFRQKKTIPFDQQYEVYKKYELLKVKNTKIPAIKMQEFIDYARPLLGKQNLPGFNAKDLRKIIKDFKEYFYG